MTRKLFLLSLILAGIFPLLSNAQSYYGGKFQIKSYAHQGFDFKLYIFSRNGATMKAKYFAQNAYSQYVNWKYNKEILLVTAGAFSDSWYINGKPVGLCVDNGSIVNKSINNEMDGMVIVYNGSTQAGGVAVVDLDMNPVTVETNYGSGRYEKYYPRNYVSDRNNFLYWGERNGVTLFQTQLVYSSDKRTNFGNLYYGKRRERRFLALCKKNGFVHHVVIDAPDPLELNRSAQYAKSVLEYVGFDVLYILNLDTGGKNILYVNEGRSLRNLNPNPEASITDATNLIVYYRD